MNSEKVLIVFDIDDTLTNSEDQHQWAFVRAMQEMGIGNIDQHWAAYLHHTDSWILKQNYERNFDDSFALSQIPGFEDSMDALMNEKGHTTEIPGARRLLTSLLHNNIPHVFATGSLHKPAIRKLREAQLPFNPNLVVGSNRFFSREEIVKQAIEVGTAHYKHEQFDRIISIGDGLWDLHTARNLGLEFIGIGSKNEAIMRDHGMSRHTVDWSAISTDWLIGVK